MWATIFGIVWTIIKSFFTKKDPAEQQLKADLDNARKIRNESDEFQKPIPDKKTIINDLP